MFAGRKLLIEYRNDGRLEYGAYRVGSVRVDGEPAQYRMDGGAAVIARGVIRGLDPDAARSVEIILTGKEGA
jgi:hypothetical protein